MSQNAKQQFIRLPVIREYIKIVRNLASHGRHFYQKYLIVPLSAWSRDKPSVSLQECIDDLNRSGAVSDPAVRAAAYKRAIIRSVDRDQFDLTLPGNLCRDFFREMCDWSQLAYTAESVQLIRLLTKPFAEFSKYESEHISKKFESDLADGENDDLLVSALAKSKKNEEAIMSLRREAQTRVNELMSEVRSLSEEKLKQRLVSFILLYSTADAPDSHLAVRPLIERVDKRRAGFAGEIMDSVAVVIYREIMNAIQKNDLRKAVVLISKYTVIFRGNPSTRYYHEVDAFERRLFEIIDKKNLWFSV